MVNHSFTENATIILYLHLITFIIKLLQIPYLNKCIISIQHQKVHVTSGCLYIICTPNHNPCLFTKSFSHFLKTLRYA